MKQESKLIICLNSLHHLQLAEYDIIIIDEIETFLNKFVDNDFMKASDKVIIWRELIRMLNFANKVILLDAFITKKTTNFIKHLKGKSTLYRCTIKPEERTVTFHKKHQTLINSIIDDLKAGKKLFIFYAYKTNCGNCPSMEALHALLEKETGTSGKFINADKDDKELKELEDVNKHWKDVDFVITNNKITVGLNYDNEEYAFDKEYMFAANYNIARDKIQWLARARHVKERKIDFCYIGSMRETTTWKIDTHVINCPIYTSLIDSVIVELKSPVRETFQLFCTHANYKMISDDSLLEDTVNKEIDSILKEAMAGYSYTAIENIDSNTASILNQKFMEQKATMLEKIQLQKFFFRMQFIHDATFEEIITKDGETENMILYCWEQRDLFLFKRFKTILNDENNIFNKIKAFNGLDSIFTEDIKKLKLNFEIVAEIFEQFEFKYLTPKSAHITIIKAVYNTYFNQEMIVTKQQKSKNCVHEFPNYDECVQKFEFAKIYMKKTDYRLKTQK